MSAELDFQIAAIDFSLPWDDAQVTSCIVNVDGLVQSVRVPPRDPQDFNVAWPVSEKALTRPQCSCLVKLNLKQPLEQDPAQSCVLGEVKVPLKTLAAVRGACVDMWFRILLRDDIRNALDTARVRLVLCLSDATSSCIAPEVRRGLCGALSFPDQVRRLLTIQQVDPQLENATETKTGERDEYRPTVQETTAETARIPHRDSSGPRDNNSNSSDESESSGEEFRPRDYDGGEGHYEQLEEEFESEIPNSVETDSIEHENILRQQAVFSDGLADAVSGNDGLSSADGLEIEISSGES